jgi:hypothetical protein
MGKKINGKINELRAKALAGDRMAQQALAAMTYVPPHLRMPDPLGARHRRRGYSGVKANAYEPTSFKPGIHVTAKTLQAVRCQVSTNVDPDYGMDRLQMLKDRRERRAAA